MSQNGAAGPPKWGPEGPKTRPSGTKKASEQVVVVAAVVAVAVAVAVLVAVAISNTSITMFIWVFSRR